MTATDAHFGLAAQLFEAARSVCRVFAFGAQNKVSAIGSGFTVAEGEYVVTAEHVVTGSSECVVAIGGPAVWSSKATVALTDATNDIAILRLDRRAASSLSLAPLGEAPAGGPLVCWEDTVVDEQPEKPPFDFRLLSLQVVSCLPLPTLRLRTLQGGERLGLAGSLRPGMSGGPVFAPLISKVVGVVCATPPFDPHNVVAAWADHYREFEHLSGNLGLDVEDLLKAQLQCGIGLAVPAIVPISMLAAVANETAAPVA